MKNYQKIPRAQQKNIKNLTKTQREISQLVVKLKMLQKQRHKQVERIFKETEKNPSLYVHLVKKGKKRYTEVMTKDAVKKLRSEYKKAIAMPLAAISDGPGCTPFDIRRNCVCLFHAGPLICWACLGIPFLDCTF